jgi:hypothetical protein
MRTDEQMKINAKKWHYFVNRAMSFPIFYALKDNDCPAKQLFTQNNAEIEKRPHFGSQLPSEVFRIDANRSHSRYTN